MVSEVLDVPDDFLPTRTIQTILDLKDLMFAELFYGFPQYMRIAGFYKHLETNSKYF